MNNLEYSARARVFSCKYNNNLLKQAGPFKVLKDKIASEAFLTNPNLDLCAYESDATAAC